jgi:hypothetical protein
MANKHNKGAGVYSKAAPIPKGVHPGRKSGANGGATGGGRKLADAIEAVSRGNVTSRKGK